MNSRTCNSRIKSKYLQGWQKKVWEFPGLTLDQNWLPQNLDLQDYNNMGKLHGLCNSFHLCHIFCKILCTFHLIHCCTLKCEATYIIFVAYTYIFFPDFSLEHFIKHKSINSGGYVRSKVPEVDVPPKFWNWADEPRIQLFCF